MVLANTDSYSSKGNFRIWPRRRRRALHPDHLGRRSVARGVAEADVQELRAGAPAETSPSGRGHRRVRARRTAGSRRGRPLPAVRTLNDLIAALVVVEPANLAGPFWELADHDDALRQAQHRAVADAKRRAEGYVDALGCRLGPLLRVSDSLGGPQPARVTMEAAVHLAGSAYRPDIAELSLEPQPVVVTATCTMAWTIADQPD